MNCLWILLDLYDFISIAFYGLFVSLIYFIFKVLDINIKVSSNLSVFWRGLGLLSFGNWFNQLCVVEGNHSNRFEKIGSQQCQIVNAKLYKKEISKIYLWNESIILWGSIGLDSSNDSWLSINSSIRSSVSNTVDNKSNDGAKENETKDNSNNVPDIESSVSLVE